MCRVLSLRYVEAVRTDLQIPERGVADTRLTARGHHSVYASGDFIDEHVNVEAGDPMRFENQIYIGQEIHLDGNEYVKCKFEKCRLVYEGTASVGLVGCVFSNVAWTFSGHAANTLEFMTALYRGGGEGGRQLIEQTFENIRRGTHPRKQ